MPLPRIDLLVVCPLCDGPAHISARTEPATLLCSRCGARREHAEDPRNRYGPQRVYSRTVLDPYFGLRLFLQFEDEGGIKSLRNEAELMAAFERLRTGVVDPIHELPDWVTDEGGEAHLARLEALLSAED